MCFSLIFSFLTLPAILFVLRKIILYKKKVDIIYLIIAWQIYCSAYQYSTINIKKQ